MSQWSGGCLMKKLTTIHDEILQIKKKHSQRIVCKLVFQPCLQTCSSCAPFLLVVLLRRGARDSCSAINFADCLDRVPSKKETGVTENE